MSEELVKSVQDMLNEEKWTRAAISNYTKNQFIEFAILIEKAREANCLDEVKAICDEYLVHTNNSIIALYLAGMIGLKKHTLDNSALTTLVNIFINQPNKQDIVVYLCESILGEDENNKFALHTLTEYYKNDEKKHDELYKLYETIVQVDHEEADIAKLLAKEYEESDKEKSIKYYKKALPRYINKRAFNEVKDVWTRLLELIPEELDFFYTIQRKVSKTIGDDKAIELL
jgi:transcription elongation factor GreA-like protein